VIFSALVYLFAWSSIFSVSHISITGAPTSDSKETVMQILDIAPGEKMARVEPHVIATRIESIDWVKSVEISRHWLSGHVEIVLTPRVPTAYFKGETIDATGKSFALPGFSRGTLPIVIASKPKIGLAAAALFENLPPAFKSDVVTISAHDTSNYLLHMNIDGRDLRISWGKNEETTLKIEVIKGLLALPENKNIRRIDVSAPHAPIVK